MALAVGRQLHASAAHYAAAATRTQDTYSHGHHRSVVGMHAVRTAEVEAAYLLPHLRAGQRLLDVGCGPGTITKGFAERVGAEGHVTAIDTVDAVLEQAEAVLAGLGNVTVSAESVYDLSAHADGSFDVVHAHQVLQHLADPVGALREMRRVCATGGVVAVRDADYATMQAHPEPRCGGLDRWRSVYTAVARSNDAEPNAGRWLMQWMEEAGFRSDDVQFSAAPMVYSAHDEAARTGWGEGWAERCVSSAFGKQAVSDGLATAEEMRSISAAWKEWSGEPNGVFCELPRPGSDSDSAFCLFCVISDSHICGAQTMSTGRRSRPWSGDTRPHCTVNQCTLKLVAGVHLHVNNIF